jgi:hypothetical protein
MAGEAHERRPVEDRSSDRRGPDRRRREAGAHERRRHEGRMTEEVIALQAGDSSQRRGS